MKDPTGRTQLQAAKAGSEPDIAAVLARFMPLVQHCARRAAGPGLDYEDAVQEGIIGLFSAIQTYSEGRRAGFATYAQVCVKNAVLSARRAAGRQKQLPLNQSVPIPENQSVPGPEDAAIARLEMAHTLEKAAKELSGMELQVLRLYLSGYSHRQIARRLSGNEKAVENALARVRRKLKQVTKGSAF